MFVQGWLFGVLGSIKITGDHILLTTKTIWQQGKYHWFANFNVLFRRDTISFSVRMYIENYNSKVFLCIDIASGFVGIALRSSFCLVIPIHRGLVYLNMLKKLLWKIRVCVVYGYMWFYVWAHVLCTHSRILKIYLAYNICWEAKLCRIKSTGKVLQKRTNEIDYMSFNISKFEIQNTFKLANDGLKEI